MQLRSLLLSIAALSTFGFSASNHAADSTSSTAAARPAPKGCYTVTRGYKSELAAAHDLFIGSYAMVLTPNEATNRTMPGFALIGSVLDAGDPPDSTNPTAHHTHHHVMGTFSGLGTLRTAKDTVVFTSASCPDAAGEPQYIKGTQTLNFVGGTGAYAGLVSGQIEFTGTFNACTNPANPVLRGTVTKGVLCFR
jgi:hypothetical protein